MKKSVFILSFLLLSKAYSYDAIVIVLEAPLLKEPKLNSIVLQTLRKGSRVYVPKEIGDLFELPEFIQTYDRVGNLAFVPTKYIKIVTHDLSESRMPITYPQNDPTDYRLEEPIPQSYPFDNTSFLRASLALTMSNNIKAPFDYNSNFSKQTFSTESGGRLIITHKINFDRHDRYYFGFFGAITTSNNTIQFKNENKSSENRSILRLGPVITFDAFKTNNYRFTLGTGFTYNYHKSALKMSGAAGSEERLFSGYSLSPMANTQVQVTDVLPQTDLIAGADFSLFLPHTQKSKDEIAIPELWGTESPTQIQSGLKTQVAFFLGVQVKY
ncbi:MAG: hypothetical protein PHY93_15830 [Bacteriovorax sp.]|nr:hypothetical protein [Bacteriovorax sp.]